MCNCKHSPLKNVNHFSIILNAINANFIDLCSFTFSTLLHLTRSMLRKSIQLHLSYVCISAPRSVHFRHSSVITKVCTVYFVPFEKSTKIDRNRHGIRNKKRWSNQCIRSRYLREKINNSCVQKCRINNVEQRCNAHKFKFSRKDCERFENNGLHSLIYLTQGRVIEIEIPSS